MTAQVELDFDLIVDSLDDEERSELAVLLARQIEDDNELLLLIEKLNALRDD